MAFTSSSQGSSGGRSGSELTDDDNGGEVTLVGQGLETDCPSFILHGSLRLTGIIQECILRIQYLRSQASGDRKNILWDQDDGDNKDPAVCPEGDDDGTTHINFSETVVQLNLLLRKWEALMFEVVQQDFESALKAVYLSSSVVKFIGRVREELLDHLRTIDDKERDFVAKSKLCFLRENHLKMVTHLFCHVLNLSWRRNKSKELATVLHMFMDALEAILEGGVDNIRLEITVVGDWFFLLSIPWLRKLGPFIPQCHSVTELNLILDSELSFDTMCQTRCLTFFRFEVFLPFRDAIRKILQDVMSFQKPNRTCFSMLKIISEAWWPVELFSWTELFRYCCYLYSLKKWSRVEELGVALAEAFVRLPCIYTYLSHHKSVLGSTELTLRVPKPRECKFCERSRGFRRLWGENGRRGKYTLRAMEELQLRAVFLEMLKSRKTKVHLVLVNMLISLRRHSRIRLLTFLDLFFKIYAESNLVVRLKAADIYGYCCRQKKAVQQVFKLSSSCRGSVSKPSARISQGKSSHLVTKSRRRRGESYRKLLAAPVGDKNSKLRKNASKQVPAKSEFKEPPSRAIQGEQLRPYSSQMDIWTRSKAAPDETPPLGGFDAATLFSNTFLYDLCRTCHGLSETGVRSWSVMVGYHLVFFNLSRHVDCDVFAVEVIKFYLNMVAKIGMVTLLILCRRSLMVLADRADCKPWELCGRYRDAVAEEIRKICFDQFFKKNVRRNDDRAIKSCMDFLLKIRIVLDSTAPNIMMSTFLRIVTKRCVLTMFQDPRAYNLIAAIAKSIGDSSTAEFLQLEFAYYYPYALLHSSQNEFNTLVRNLKESFKFDPSTVMKMNPQFLHIEMLSHIFECREAVIANYPSLLPGEENDCRRASRVVKAIGRALDKWYMGVFLYFESKFTSASESLISKRRYLGCFTSLMGLLGKQKVSSSRLKLYSLLNALRTMGSEFHDLMCQAWRTFVLNLGDELLGPMANQILAGIEYLRETRRSEVDSLCKIIISNTEVQDYIKHLHFLRDVSGDDTVKTKVEDALQPFRNSSAANLFFHQLIDELGHENSHVRYRALITLKRRLQKNITDLEDLQFVDQLFSHKTTLLFRNLLNATKYNNCAEVEELSASCIGMIGALDPSRFDLRSQLSDNARFGLTIFTVGETDFLRFIIEELTRVLRGSVDTQNFDSCAFCIQEVIKLYKIEQTMEDPVWSKLSQRAKDLMIPLFSSKYSRSDFSSGLPQCPVYMTDYGRTLSKWLYNWMRVLLSVIRSEELRKFFEAVVSTVEKSEQMGLVILPYIVSYAIMEGLEYGAEFFLEEVNAVLRQWIDQDIINRNRFPDSELVSDTTIPDDMSSTPCRKLSEWENAESAQMQTYHEDFSRMQFTYAATQAIFKAMDHLQRLVRNPKNPPKRRDVEHETPSQMTERISASRSISLEASRPILQAQKLLRYDVLSQAAFECRNFSRSLMYMEQHLEAFRDENKQTAAFNKCFGSLQRIYVALADEDSVKGLETKRQKEITVMEDALNKLSQGKLEGCMPLFETVLASDPEDLVSHQQLVQAYLGLEKFHVSKTLIDGCCSQRPEWAAYFNEASLEICIKKGDDKELQRRLEALSCSKLSSWGRWVSEAYLHYNQGLMRKSEDKIRVCRQHLMKDMCDGAAYLDIGFYFRHYNDLLRLQLLTEFDEMQRVVALKLANSRKDRLLENFQRVKTNWERRLKCSNKSVEILQTIMSFRKSLLTTSKKFFMDDERMAEAVNMGLRDCYIRLAKMESSLGNFGRAEQLFTECKLSTKLSVFYEEGKMLYQSGKYNQSIKVLKAGMDAINAELREEYRLKSPTDDVTEEQRRLSKAFLLFAIQKDEQREVDLSRNVENYKYAIAINKRSEKNYFYMALYYDRLWSQAEERDRQTQAQILMVQNYGLSLIYGCNFIYQSLPRMLTIWFDYAAQSQSGSTRSSSPPADVNVVQQLTESIRKLVRTAPTYIFIVAFSQLISRLTHSSSVVYSELKEIIVRMIIANPDQLLWLLLSPLKSPNKKRADRCTEIFKLAEQKQPRLRSKIRSYAQLQKELIKFTDKKTENMRFTKVSELLPTLPQLIRNKEFAEVLIPFQVFMRPCLPRGGKYVDSHEPFPRDLAYIKDIAEPVHVMTSLQKPKRIRFIGSDGNQYPIMCKPSDDLRKDAKVMEINDMVQWYLKRDKESRKRNLVIRTYTVIPLSDNCGILEFISNLHGYRPLLVALYKEGIGFGPGQQRPTHLKFCERKDSFELKKKLFKERFVNSHPLVMSQWFLKAFHDPQSWYMARTSYVKTAAVMSIIGYLMGLGDRHGENILIDSSNGDVVHVDYNCLFNKGETLDWPERVPFRLTRNMINGMGPLGYEGTFRCCCEIVMRVIRNHSSVFLSIIRPFVFDPLVEWQPRMHPNRKSESEGEINNQKAVEHLNNIRDRLLGSARNMTKERNVALSVEAHVSYLIKEATKLDNLCQMYIGWAAYL